jgi:hypothetical protein
MFFNPSPELRFPVLGSRHIKDGPDLSSAPSDKGAFGSPRLFSGLKQPAIRFRPSAQQAADAVRRAMFCEPSERGRAKILDLPFFVIVATV